METNNTKTDIKQPLLIGEIIGCNSWDQWLEITEKYLLESGYKKYENLGSHKRFGSVNPDFTYVKLVTLNDNRSSYFITLYFYDWRKDDKKSWCNEGISYTLECTLITNSLDSICLDVKKNISLNHFENMCRAFHDSIFFYLKSKEPVKKINYQKINQNIEENKNHKQKKQFYCASNKLEGFKCKRQCFDCHSYKG